MKRYKILIVDDDEEIRRLLNWVFTRAGFEVKTANDGAAAISMLQVEPFDVILTDIEMPRISGDRALAAFRFIPYGRRTPVFVMTAMLDPKLKLEMEAAGIAGFFYKPLPLDELVNTIRSRVQNSNDTTV